MAIGGLLPQKGLLRIIVLGLLAEKPMHGYELLKKIEEITGGSWRPSPGSLYTLLKNLHTEGLIATERIEARRVPSGMRIVYRITSRGHDYLTAHAPRIAGLLGRIAAFLGRIHTRKTPTRHQQASTTQPKSTQHHQEYLKEA